jgi:hypothetical protein
MAFHHLFTRVVVPVAMRQRRCVTADAAPQSDHFLNRCHPC